MTGIPSQAQYEAGIDALAERLRDHAEARLDAGWAPEIAFAAAADSAAGTGTDEATIQMMTYAIGKLHPAVSSWKHAAALLNWWNARFESAARIERFDMAMPCVLHLNGFTVAVASPWSVFTSDWAREAAQ